MSKTIKLRKVICNLKEDFKATEELIYNRTSKGVTIMSAKNAGISRAPKWFMDWSTSFEKKNDERWERQEKFNKEVIKRLDGLETRMDNLETKVDAISQRLDNIVVKNNLSE